MADRQWQKTIKEGRSTTNPTLWQETMSEGFNAFPGGDSVAAAERLTGTPADVEDNSTDGIANRIYERMHGGQSYGSPEARVQDNPDGDTIVELPVAHDPSMYDDDENRVFSQIIGTEKAYRERATKEAIAKYGKEFLEYDPEERRQIVEYETDALLEAQFGRPMRDYDTVGTAAQGYQEGFESSFAGNADTLISAATGTGGRLTPPDTFAAALGRLANWFDGDKSLGQKFKDTANMAYSSYDELIPGFKDMELGERREAIANWKQKSLDRAAVERNARQEGALYNVAKFGGWLTDPTTAIPVGQTYKVAAAASGLVAGSDVFLYDLAQKGEIDPKRVLTGTAIGAVGGPAMLWGGRKIRGLMKSRHYNSILNKYEKEYTRALATGDSKDMAELYARVASGNMSQEGLDSLYTFTGRTKVVPDTPHAAKLAMEERLSFIHRYETLAKVGRKIEDVITPISDRISRISPKIAHGMRKLELGTHVQQHLWFDEVRPWAEQLRKMSKADKKALHRAIFTEDAKQWGEAYNIMRKYEKQGDAFKGMVDNFDKVRTVLKEVGMRYKQSGFNLNLKEHYFPRVANDPSAIKKMPYSFVQDALDKARKAKGKELTEREIQRVFEDLVTFRPDPQGKVKTSGSLRERTVKDEWVDALFPHYADPEAALHSYLRMASIDLNRAKFMKNFGYKGKFLTEGTDIQDHISEVIAREQKRIGFSNDKRDELIELLQSRFTTGERAPSGFIRGFKNLGYMTTLGNPISAMTQLGDQAFSMYKSGVLEATRSAFSPRFISKIDLGLEEAMEEIYANPSMLKRGLDRSLRWGGFNTMDKFGKDTIINGVLRKSMKQLQTDKGRRAFVAKWGRYFGNETSSLMADIKKFNKPYSTKVTKGKNAGKVIERYGDMTDNMRLMLWHELSDVQPIALSEMPKFYLDNPNGRVLYMLKTFTIKQVDFMRREIFRKMAEGKYTEAGKNAAYFTAFWMAMNGSADALKSIFTGDDFDINDNMIENLMQLTVWSRYSNEQALKAGVGQAVRDFMFPPTPFIDQPFLSVVRGQPELAIEPVPVVGKIISKRVQNARKSREKMLSGNVGDMDSGRAWINRGVEEE